MLPEDEVAFDGALSPAIADLGRWQTHDHQARTITLHDSLPAAIRHNSTQAFLRLLSSGGSTTGPLIQYLTPTVVTTDETLLAAAGRRFLPAADRPEAMSPGRLAFRWFPQEQTECVRRDFAILADLAWKALQAVTSPHVQTATGNLARRYRIGPAAEAWALTRPRLLLHDGALQLKIRPTHGTHNRHP